MSAPPASPQPHARPHPGPAGHGHRKWHDETVRVIVAEELALRRRRLQVVLGDQPDIDVMADVGDLDQLAALMLELLPDVVVLGPALPPRGTVRAVATVRELVPGAEPVVLWGEGDDDTVRAVRAGAAAFLPAASAAEDAVGVVRAAARRRPVLPSGVAAAVLAELDRVSRGEGTGPAWLGPPAPSADERAALVALAATTSPSVTPVERARRDALARNALDRLARHARAEAVLRLVARTPAA